ALSVVQMVEQLFGFRIIRSELQGFFEFGARQLWLFLFEINTRKRGARNRGITRLQRGLQLPRGVIELPTAVRHFGQTTPPRGIARLCRDCSAKGPVGLVQLARREILPPAANEHSGSILVGGPGTSGNRGASRLPFQMQAWR